MTAVESTDAGAGNRFTAAVDYTAAGLNELKNNNFEILVARKRVHNIHCNLIFESF